MAPLHCALLVALAFDTLAVVDSEGVCAAASQECQGKRAQGADESALVQKTINVHSAAVSSQIETEHEEKADAGSESDSEASITPPRLPCGQPLMGKKMLTNDTAAIRKVEADIKVLLEDAKKAEKVLHAQSTCARKKVMTGFQGLNGPVVNKLHDMQMGNWLAWHDMQLLMGNAIMKGIDDLLAGYEKGEKWDTVQSAAVNDATLQYPALEGNLLITARRLWSIVIQGVGYEWGRVAVLNQKEHADLTCAKAWDPLIETRVASFNLWNTTSVLMDALSYIMPLSPNGTEDNSWYTLSPQEQHRMLEVGSSTRMDPDLPLAARIQAIASLLETLSGYVEVGQMAAATKVEICIRPPTDFDPPGAYEMEDKCTDEVLALQWGNSGASSLRFGLGLAMGAIAAFAAWI